MNYKINHSASEISDFSWSDDARARLRAAVEAVGLLKDVAARAGMTPNSLSAMLKTGSSEPSASRLARVAAAAGVSIDYVLSGADVRAAPDDVAYLPCASGVSASAGHGSFGDEEEEAREIPFPKRWLRREFGDPANLALIQVEGDSMLPEFPDGSWAMYDKSRKGPGPGTYVIRLEGVIKIKDVHFRDLDIMILSRHFGYDGSRVTLKELADDPTILEILGRVVWSGNLLA